MAHAGHSRAVPCGVLHERACGDPHETQSVDTPAVDTPAVDVPAVDVPAVEVPAMEVPVVEVRAGRSSRSGVTCPTIARHR